MSVYHVEELVAPGLGVEWDKSHHESRRISLLFLRFIYDLWAQPADT